ncbi:hypothetical protein SAMN04487866_10292 [Thermoactinomyces sp. DSM 45891]|uniref:prealbumin-like fold domain-containing protein n=1 Tax=Thermoactinomyces sp. DSM 45891 TaxID=1761907 RepID=UPI00091AAA3E|nr:SpaA isopeptide-forming pilin-related protein [Thermoactinomyces sp. DSM 45891]SFX19174.1 hypothetical protein SAMN04487866_10292 [Thermoactinomyces sp. DSM 45891]
MSTGMRYVVRLLSLCVLVGVLLFSGSMSSSVQAASEHTSVNHNKNNETGTLEITLKAMEWEYSDEEPGGFKYYPGKALPGVEFTIYKDNKEYAKKRTDKDGKISFQLPVGARFSCKQTSTYPAETGSYLPETRAFSGSFSTKGEVYQHTVYNLHSMY